MCHLVKLKISFIPLLFKPLRSCLILKDLLLSSLMPRILLPLSFLLKGSEIGRPCVFKSGNLFFSFSSSLLFLQGKDQSRAFFVQTGNDITHLFTFVRHGSRRGNALNWILFFSNNVRKNYSLILEGRECSFPTNPFVILRASKSIDRLALCGVATSIDRFWGSIIRKGLVGYLQNNKNNTKPASQ